MFGVVGVGMGVGVEVGGDSVVGLAATDAAGVAVGSGDGLGVKEGEGRAVGVLVGTGVGSRVGVAPAAQADAIKATTTISARSSRLSSFSPVHAGWVIVGHPPGCFRRQPNRQLPCSVINGFIIRLSVYYISNRMLLASALTICP